MIDEELAAIMSKAGKVKLDQTLVSDNYMAKVTLLSNFFPIITIWGDELPSSPAVVSTPLAMSVGKYMLDEYDIRVRMDRDNEYSSQHRIDWEDKEE